YFPSHETHLVHDPRSSLRTGDIVRIVPGWRVSKHVRHVVAEIVAPFGPRVDERPRVLSEEEREEERRVKREAKVRRREGRRGGVVDGEGNDNGEEREREGEGEEGRRREVGAEI
ncbi:MAG: hypothetical protein M1830_004121, partial [Pleopsidium flavum]